MQGREDDLSLERAGKVTCELGLEGRVGVFQTAERERHFRKRKERRWRPGDQVHDLVFDFLS